MKNLLIVFALVALALCDKPRYPLRDVKRKQFRKEIIDCILNNENSSEELKNKVKKEIDDEYRKILHIFIAKLNQEDREIIRKCRRIYFGKIRDMYKERMNQKYNKNYTHHHIHDEEQLHSTSSLVSAPSTITSIPLEWPNSVKNLVMVLVFSSVTILSVKDLSILIASNGI